AVTVDAGSHTVVEDAVAGYTTSYASDAAGHATDCTALPVANGGTRTCTVTNDDQPGTLTVTKNLVTDNGGSLTCADFSFSVDGGLSVPFEADCSNAVTVDAGSHTVVEDAVAGYTTSYASDAAGHATDCTALPVANGGTRTCTVTNDDQPGTLTVTKNLVTDNGGSLTCADFSFSVDGGL